ncbi:phosphoribosylaminoimidazole-succinocarboxamide synthase [Lophiotrema nucula]|uniref:Phosphoribosylaminoimidazole-succinocarboxamide synthase n=1 Tax=Lophiotrema nucula TaxID=690887 RepID=A0A6A5YS91_9PLEO|nr:phosphoribosylaminoimidazole-succinocarboxamide synthase [Lophiotrema nucula]
MPSSAVVSVDLRGKLHKIASGKIRDLFEVDNDTLLFVATDRISAYDVVMDNGIPGKGALLTKMSIYWFKYLQAKIPGLQTHYITNSLPSALDALPFDMRESVQTRSMQVRRLEVFPLESIVRGYITGSAWSEYKKSGTIHGIPQPSGLVEGQKLPEPIWTPSTKAELGEHDENITPEKARQMVGEGKARIIEGLSLELYKAGAKRAEEVGIILADTKFEFGHEGEQVVLIDEVLTPDSSRFWPKETWEQSLGGAQPSFDKQFLRDWLTTQGLKGTKGVTIAEDIVEQTAKKYRDAYERITGESYSE